MEFALFVRDLFPPSVANTAYFESLCSLFTFVSVSILNLALFCSTLPVALIVVDLSPPQSCFVLLKKVPDRKKIPATLTRDPRYLPATRAK